MGDDMKGFICLLTIFIIMFVSALCFAIVYDISVKYVKNEPKPQNVRNTAKKTIL